MDYFGTCFVNINILDLCWKYILKKFFKREKDLKWTNSRRKAFSIGQYYSTSLSNAREEMHHTHTRRHVLKRGYFLKTKKKTRTINDVMCILILCMSYALMLFEELFASQLSVPSSPMHFIKCTTRSDERKWKITVEGNEKETKEKHWQKATRQTF